MSSAPFPTLILYFESREHWRRAIARGVLDYVRKATPWRPMLVTEPTELLDLLHDPRRTERVVGLIGAFFEIDAPCVARAKTLGLPIVNTSSWKPPADVDWVHPDHREIGRMAARHFLDRGHRHFAYLGVASWPASQKRCQGFQEHLHTCRRPPASVYDREEDPAALMSWVHALPFPCALLACNDMRAEFLFEHLDLTLIDVPGQLAVLGVDDDDLLCNISPIPLSSIRPDWERIGLRAALALHTRLRTESRRSRRRVERIPPREVVLRQSSDVLAVNDDLVQRAFSEIRHHLHHPPTVAELAERLGVSSRTLSRRVRGVLGKSVKQTIVHAQLEKAYDLVANSNLPIGEIAVLSGFRKQSRFNAAFRERYQMTPSRLRRGRQKN